MKHALLSSVAVVMPLAFTNDVPFNETCEVVTVVGENGKPLRINKSDFLADQAEGGEKKFELHKADAKTVQAVSGAAQTNPLPENIIVPPAPAAPVAAIGDPVAPTNPSLGQKLVAKDGKKFFVVEKISDTEFPKLTGVPGINEAGYASEKEAWDAIVALAQAGGNNA